MNHNRIFDTGLSFRELAVVTGLHFTTIARLKKTGATRPMLPLTKRRLDAVTPILVKLIESGKLPMNPTSERAKRKANVEKLRGYVDAQVAP